LYHIFRKITKVILQLNVFNALGFVIKVKTSEFWVRISPDVIVIAIDSRANCRKKIILLFKNKT
jgi:hypothetical protein